MAAEEITGLMRMMSHMNVSKVRFPLPFPISQMSNTNRCPPG